MGSQNPKMGVFTPPLGGVKNPQNGGILAPWGVVWMGSGPGRRPTENRKMPVLTRGRVVGGAGSSGVWPVHSPGHTLYTLDNAPRAPCMGMYPGPTTGPLRVFRSKTGISGKKRVFLAKTRYFWPKNGYFWPKPGISGQNRSKNRVFLAKTGQKRVYRVPHGV